MMPEWVVVATIILWAAMVYEARGICPICGHEKGPRHRCPA